MRTRIITDFYNKNGKKVNAGVCFTQETCDRINSIRDVYAALDQSGILSDISFAYNSFPNSTAFALEACKIIPYFKFLREKNIPHIELALRAIREVADGEYDGRLLCGGATLSQSMDTYREDNYRCSWKGHGYYDDFLKNMRNSMNTFYM